ESTADCSRRTYSTPDEVDEETEAPEKGQVPLAAPAEESQSKGHRQPKQGLSWAALQFAVVRRVFPAPCSVESDLVLVQNVSKLYRLYRRPADRLREM